MQCVASVGGELNEISFYAAPTDVDYYITHCSTQAIVNSITMPSHFSKNF